MRLIDYIQGNRRGKDANRIEREAMNDPFLQDALDGFDAVSGNHAQIIVRLERQFTQPAIKHQRNKKMPYYWSVAASVLLVIGFGAYIFWGKPDNSTSVIAINQPDESGKEISDDFLELQYEQIELSQHDLPLAARTFPNDTPKPSPSRTPLSPEMEESSEIFADVAMAIEADEMIVDEMIVEEVARSRLVETSAKRMVHEQAEDAMTKTSDFALNEVAVAEKEAQKQANTESAASRSNRTATPLFGEKEFQAYCQQRVDKHVCSGKDATVKLSFYIDEKGKPTKIIYHRYTCEEAKKEMENIFSSSPAWTRKNRKVNMTIRLKK